MSRIDEVVGLRVKDQGRVYLHQNANWNVTAMTDLTGRVIERYWYSPYGQLEAVVAGHPFDYDDDGDVDDDDYAVTTNGTCSGTAAGDCRRMDANADGVVNSADQTIIAAYVATLDSDTELQRIPATTHSRRGNVFGHQGLVLDAELASYQNRARQYAPKAKRFMQRDPLAYRDGMSAYTSTQNAPTRRLDPLGLTVTVLPTQYVQRSLLQFLQNYGNATNPALINGDYGTTQVDIQSDITVSSSCVSEFDCNCPESEYRRWYCTATALVSYNVIVQVTLIDFIEDTNQCPPKAAWAKQLEGVIEGASASHEAGHVDIAHQYFDDDYGIVETRDHCNRSMAKTKAETAARGRANVWNAQHISEHDQAQQSYHQSSNSVDQAIVNFINANPSPPC